MNQIPGFQSFLSAPARADTISGGDLSLYEMQKPMVEPLLRMLRLTNTSFDILFYDVIPLSQPVAALIEESIALCAAPAV